MKSRLTTARVVSNGKSSVAAGISGWVYAVAAFALTARFIRHAWAVYSLRDGEKAEHAPKKLFGYSILYLFAMFGSLLVDRAVSLTGWI